MTGIMEIPLKKFCMLAATHTIWKRTHHFAVALKSCCKTARSFDRIYTFNPFVVGSTPARPTIKKLKAPCTKVWGAFSFACRTTKKRDARA
jgi:hypothetical protein